MAKKRVYNYEAMFLLSQAVAADLNSATEHIKEIISRGHGEIIAMRKWDERRLAYEIQGQKRGYYVLVYFKAPGVDIAHVERDCNLSEKVLRTMILRCDHMTEEEMAGLDARKELEVEAKLRAERPVVAAPVAAAEPAPAAEEPPQE
ncbi:30S ribosomal protein S6 [Phycisphaerales bacterium]|nr:30S ribosomal protein S6 [Phycisphaerales bacterium]